MNTIETQSITKNQVGNLSEVVDNVLNDTALATIDYGAATAEFQDDFDRSSLQVPFFRILQSNSPELDPSEAKFVDAARVGMILNTATGELFSSFEMAPIYHHATGIQWKTRESGGGFVKDLGLDGYNQALPTTARNEKGHDILPNGDQLVRTEIYFVRVIREDGSTDTGMLSLTSTQLKKAKQLNSKAKSLKTTYPDGSVTPRVTADGFSQIATPLFANLWRVSTIQESNEKGKWYGFVFTFSRPTFAVNPQLFAQVLEDRKTFSDAVKTGAVDLAGAAETKPTEDTPF